MEQRCHTHAAASAIPLLLGARHRGDAKPDSAANPGPYTGADSEQHSEPVAGAIFVFYILYRVKMYLW